MIQVEATTLLNQNGYAGYTRAWQAERLEHIPPGFIHSCPVASASLPRGLPHKVSCAKRRVKLTTYTPITMETREPCKTDQTLKVCPLKSGLTEELASQLFILIMTLIAETLENVD